MVRLPFLLIALPTLAVASVTAAKVDPRADPATVATRPLDQLSPAQLGQRFPSQSRSDPALRFTPRTGGVATWRTNVPALSNQEQITVAKIAAAFKKLADGKAVGFSVTVMGPKGLSSSVAGGSARRSVDSPARKMSDKERMSIASVSKTITAATLLRVLAAKGKSVDDAAFLYLPADWTYSPSFKTVTIRQLLTHVSGLWDSNNQGIPICGIDFAALKACAAKPLSDQGWRYANTNFALMRLMIVQLSGGPATAARAGTTYVTIVNQQTFSKVGLPPETCMSPQPNPALSYKSNKDDGLVANPGPGDFDWTVVESGQDWGNMTNFCGSQGWNLTSRELATFMHGLMLTDKILPQKSVNGAMSVDAMRAGGFGLYYDPATDAYGHGGWHPAGMNLGEINTLVVTFGNGITVAAIVNSRYNGNLAFDIATAVKSVLA